MNLKILQIGCLASAALLGSWFGLRPAPTFMANLSVGQGDCAVLTSDGATVLIDAGPKTLSFDAGEKLVLPDLKKLGITSVQFVLLSHPDIDHVGGIGAIHRAFPDAKFMISAEFRQWPSMLKRITEAEIPENDFVWVPADSKMAVGQFNLTLWCPSMAGRKDDNDGSMFVRVVDGTATAVFSGDAPVHEEKEAIKHGTWTAQVLKAGHHGSRTATSQAWLDAVHPKIAVLSVGRNNRYGHPHREVVDRLQTAGIEVWRTDRQGDAIFDVTSNGFEIRR